MLCHQAFCLVVDDNQFTPGKQHAQRIFYSDAHVKRLMVVFLEIYPYEPARPEIVVQVEYQPELASEADRTEFQKRVFAKFGPAVGNKTDDPEWCRFEVNYVGGWGCDDPHLRMASWSQSGVGLYLDGDRNLYQRELDLWNSQRHSAQPPL